MYTQRIAILAAIVLVLSIVSSVVSYGGDTLAKQDQTSVTAHSSDLERLLPDSTLGFIRVKNVAQLTERWNRLGFRSPMANPALLAVIARMEEQFPQAWQDAKLSWSDLLTLPGGGACIAVVESTPGRAAIVFGIDVRDRHKEAIAFFDHLGRSTQPNESLSPAKAHEDATIVEHPILSYFLKGDLLVVTSDREVTQSLLASWPGSGAVVQSEAYRAVMEQCQADAEKTKPDICCFLRPIEFLSARMTLKTPKSPMTAQQYGEQAKMTGFDAIRGVGGVCWFDRGPQALLYRVAVYAPDRTGWAMKMLRMPNRQSHEPPPWAPNDVEAFGDFYWEMQQAFGPFCKVFSLGIDASVWEQDLFDDVLDAMRDDPRGPQVDLRKDFVERLSERVLVFRGAKSPNESVWQATVVGLEVTDEAAVAKSLKEYLRRGLGEDPNIVVVDYDVQGNTLYEVKENDKEDSPAPPEIGFAGAAAVNPSEPAKPSSRKRSEKDSDERHADHPIFISVAHGYLLWGNDGDLLRSLLTAGAPLAEDANYIAVRQELAKLNAGPVSFLAFARRGDDFGILARCMDTQKFFTPFLLEAQQREIGEPAVGRKGMLEPKTTRATVGPAGWFAESLPNGWRIVGIVLKPASTEDGVKH